MDESCIRQWSKALGFNDDLSTNLTLHSGKKSKGEQLEPVLCKFIDDLRKTNCDDTVDLIALEIMKIDADY